MKPHTWTFDPKEAMMLPDLRLWRCGRCGVAVWSSSRPRDEGGLVVANNAWIPNDPEFLDMSSDCDVETTRSVLRS